MPIGRVIEFDDHVGLGHRRRPTTAPCYLVPLHRDRRRHADDRRRRRRRVRRAAPSSAATRRPTSAVRLPRRRDASSRTAIVAVLVALGAGRGRQLRRRRRRRRVPRTGAGRRAAARRAPTSSCRGGGSCAATGGSVTEPTAGAGGAAAGRGRRSCATGGSSTPRRPLPRSVPIRRRIGRRRQLAAPLIWTKARRMLASASRIVGASGAEAVAEPVDEAGDGVDRQGGRTAGRAASAERWIAASSYSPITWLVTTTSAGTSATRRRASSIAAWASSMASAASSSVAASVAASSRGCSSASVRRPSDSSLTCATLLATIEAKWGRPPPGHHHAPAWRVRPGPTAAGDGVLGIRTASVPVAPRASRRAPTHTPNRETSPIAQE